MTDTQGRTLTISIDSTTGRRTGLTDAGDRTYTYGYTSGRLTSYRAPGASRAETYAVAVNGVPTLVLAPDTAFVSASDTVYPVTLDPTFVGVPASDAADTWVQDNDYPESQYGSAELKAGTYNGVQRARSFVRFDISALRANPVKVLDAKLRLYNTYSGSCTGATITARRIIEPWSPTTLTWANQPSGTSTNEGSASAAYGYSSSCAANYVSFDTTPIVQQWLDDGTVNN